MDRPLFRVIVDPHQPFTVLFEHRETRELREYHVECPNIGSRTALAEAMKLLAYDRAHETRMSHPADWRHVATWPGNGPRN